MRWIRLARLGCRNRHLYRQIAADGCTPLDGKPLQVLGYYSPFAGESTGTKLTADVEECRISFETQPSDPCCCVFMSAGILNPSSMMGSTLNDRHVGRSSSESSLPAQDEGESQTGQKKACPIVVGDINLLRKKINEAVSENKRELDKSFLKHRYNIEFRPHLSSHCLLLPEGLNSASTQFLHSQHHFQTRKTPKYLSSYELMIQRVRIHDDGEWDRFWNQIVTSRVFIAEDWESNIGNVETLHYDYGIKGFCKGEVDASFHDGQNVQLGKATISLIIWRDDNVLCAEVYRDVDCRSIHVAEAYAVVALFFKCFEMGIGRLVLWTDNSDIHGCHWVIHSEPRQG
ncbi:hypothetical protein C2845_PM18G06270 [Panicum miliaceum]|uniref:RNase H type-1 domain-containing protein n=1 Tax=Panicum miliaceum TaxID=4540 RepID=A0A3L6PJG7_PANMI|nr:hypothetical protein C2845_PM18G06270 [Panicum miliaceum]